MKGIIGALALAVTLGWHGAAQAEFQIQLRQISPTKIEVTGSGTALALPTNGATTATTWQNLFFDSAVPTSTAVIDSDVETGSSLIIGGTAITQANSVVDTLGLIQSSTNTNVLFGSDDQLSGSATFSFSQAVTLAAVGATGDVNSFAVFEGLGIPTQTLVVGSWTVVPLPAGVWLMVSGLAAVGGLGRWLGRRRPEAAPAAA